MRKSTRRFLLPAVLAAALLTGACQLQPGAAAFVGNTRISDNQVDSLVQSSLDAAQARSSIQQKDLIGFRQQITGLLVQSALYERAASAAGVTVTDGQVDQAIDQQAASNGGRQAFLKAEAQQGITPQLLRLQVRLNLLGQQLGKALAAEKSVPESQLRAAYQQLNVQQQTGLSFAQARDQLEQVVLVHDDLTSLAKRVNVQVSPRYGKFDVSQLSVVPTDRNLVVSSS